MNKIQLAKVLDSTNELERDILERIILGRNVSKAPGFWSNKKEWDFGNTLIDESRLHYILGIAKERIEECLYNLEELGLIYRRLGVYIYDGGPISEFFELRIAANFA